MPKSGTHMKRCTDQNCLNGSNGGLCLTYLLVPVPLPDVCTGQPPVESALAPASTDEYATLTGIPNQLARQCVPGNRRSRLSNQTIAQGKPGYAFPSSGIRHPAEPSQNGGSRACSVVLTVFRCVNHQDGAFGVCDAGGADRPYKQPAQSAVSAPANDEQIGVFAGLDESGFRVSLYKV